MTANLALELQKQLSVARNEIKNLRKQIHSLSYIHQTDLKIIKNLLTDFKCNGCKEQQRDSSSATRSIESEPSDKDQNSITFKPIGVIRTDFPEKRAVPRQPSVCSKLSGYIELNKDVFNNQHSLERLCEFSHLWIIYHFHKNDSHTKAKVAPPRLAGERVGIFSTRSPHRPCPIGMSLVEIDKIVNSQIHFLGTDMCDGTPVLDLKPYIPRYDSPIRNRLTENHSVSTEDENQGFDAREEPDGEETISRDVQPQLLQLSPSPSTVPAATSETVKVPNWILADTTMEVVFNDRATQQINELNISNEFQINRENVVEVLKNDPRSVYLKTRYGSQIFTFQLLGEVTVTCKFNDDSGVVTVLQIRKSENLSSETSQNDANAN
ncbi:tRNA (adenine(37)-N6)-methyltransferase isoform X2 [Sitodiplosis mosellana]|uniref:tRNA (adenine(37)-N6)-methyltransferase isoform X2 n=1 Tax=Sitodiplosis mosellana TaxID=263140 RepID=UPI0024444D6E|nr:tRNA (adenine(37)-N6)-methyltransferase isoform X2 [Sitodiplosis mosellana]